MCNTQMFDNEYDGNDDDDGDDDVTDDDEINVMTKIMMEDGEP